MGKWGGGREGEKYFLSYKRQLVTFVLYLLKCDRKCEKKKHVNKNRRFLRVCSFKSRQIYIDSLKGLAEPTELSLYQKDLEKIANPSLSMW